MSKITNRFIKVTAVLNFPGNPHVQRYYRVDKIGDFGPCTEDHIRSGGVTMIGFSDGTMAIVTESTEEIYHMLSQVDCEP